MVIVARLATILCGVAAGMNLYDKNWWLFGLELIVALMATFWKV